MEIVKAADISVEVLLNDIIKGPKLTEDDKKIAVMLFSKTDEDVKVCIPDNIDTETFHSWIESSSRIRAKFDYAKDMIKPVLGRLFVLVKKRKDLLDSFGCTSFTQFMDIYVPKNFHLSSQEAWAAHWTVEEYPEISCDDYNEIGISKLKIIAAAVPRDKSSDTIDKNVAEKRKELIEVAKTTKKATALATKIEEMGIAKRAQIIKDKIMIFCDLQTRQYFENMCADPRVISYAGSDNPTAIFIAMMSEFHAAAMSEAVVEKA